MKAVELLSMDFSGYKRILIHGVTIYPTKIVVVEVEADEDNSKRILVIGYKGDEEIFFTSYDQDEVINITNNKEVGLIAIRKEKRRDETN